MLSPYTTCSGRSLENDDIGGAMQFDIRFRGGEAIPTFNIQVSKLWQDLMLSVTHADIEKIASPSVLSLCEQKQRDTVTEACHLPAPITTSSVDSIVRLIGVELCR